MASTTLPLPLNFENGEDPLVVEILLTKNYIAKVDAADGDLAQFKWTAVPAGGGAYGSRQPAPRMKQHLHRVILERKIGRPLNSSEYCDHINGNQLDNRRSNLRIATRTENARNGKRRKSNKSGYKGVSWKASNKKWVAQISVDWKKIYLGLFDTPEEAYEAFCEAARKYHGEFARFE